MAEGRRPPRRTPPLGDPPAIPSPGKRLPLLWRAFLASALVMAGAALALTFAPVTIDAPISLSQLVVVLGGLGLMLLVNLWALWRVLAPLRKLKELMMRVDPSEPGQRIAGLGPHGPDVAALSLAFNQMLDRLEDERRESARGVLAGQERERQRIASELHDEIGQTLTAAAIQIERAADSPQSEVELHSVADAVRTSLDDVRRIARELRPEVLDDLGLINAIIALCSRVAKHGELQIERRLAAVPARTSEIDLVIYRVAQESLTNVVRHADAGSAVVTLGPVDQNVVLSVTDDGHGMPSSPPEDTAGVSGMRERAHLVGGKLTVQSGKGAGTNVRLEIPLERLADGPG